MEISSLFCRNAVYKGGKRIILVETPARHIINLTSWEFYGK
jgi:hypothetical protein